MTNLHSLFVSLSLLYNIDFDFSKLKSDIPNQSWHPRVHSSTDFKQANHFAADLSLQLNNLPYKRILLALHTHI